MSDPRDGLDDANSLAAEYALGLLEGDAFGEARRRAASDPDFATEVARWRGRLAPLHDEFDEVAPPVGLWRRISATVERTGAANDNAAILRRSARIWRSATAAMTAVAASLALFMLLEPRSGIAPPTPVQQPASAPMVAMLGDQGAMKVVASWDPAARQLVLAVPGEMPADPKHSHELWIIPSGGKPRSLGTMPDAKQTHMRLAEALASLLQQGATIAISVEPRGGSPTGAPTGPVVASGALSAA
jgi:anti-sigma-K factor RskA